MQQATYYTRLILSDLVSNRSLENIVSRGVRRNRRCVDACVAAEQALKPGGKPAHLPR